MHTAVLIKASRISRYLRQKIDLLICMALAKQPTPNGAFVRMNVNMRSDLEVLAWSQGSTLSNIIRQAIGQYIAANYSIIDRARREQKEYGKLR